MTYDEIAALLPQAIELHRLTKDPLALDAVRVLQEALVDAHCTPDYAPSPMQQVVFNYLSKIETARATLGL